LSVSGSWTLVVFCLVFVTFMVPLFFVFMVLVILVFGVGCLCMHGVCCFEIVLSRDEVFRSIVSVVKKKAFHRSLA